VAPNFGSFIKKKLKSQNLLKNKVEFIFNLRFNQKFTKNISLKKIYEKVE
jgi:hypothetical protein